MKAVWSAVGVACAALVAFACSSSSGSGGSASSCAQSAAGQGNTNGACSSCAESNCGSQISGYESGCSDYLSCICPGGSYNGSLAQQCVSKAQESSCTPAAESVGTCVQQHCASQCGASGSSSGGSGSGSGSSSGGSTGNVHCMFAGVDCINDVTAQACMSGGGMVLDACPTANLEGCCTKPGVEACYYNGVANAQQDCAQQGGTWSTTP